MMEARIRILTNNTQTPILSPQEVVSCSQYAQGKCCVSVCGAVCSLPLLAKPSGWGVERAQCLLSENLGASSGPVTHYLVLSHGTHCGIQHSVRNRYNLSKDGLSGASYIHYPRVVRTLREQLLRYI